MIALSALGSTQSLPVLDLLNDGCWTCCCIGVKGLSKTLHVVFTRQRSAASVVHHHHISNMSCHGVHDRDVFGLVV